MSSGSLGRFFLFLRLFLFLFLLRLLLVLDVGDTDEEGDEADEDGEDGDAPLQELDDLGPPLEAPGYGQDCIDGKEDEDKPKSAGRAGYPNLDDPDGDED